MKQEVFLVGIILLLTITVFGQELNWNPDEAGVKALSMGNAFIGVADDPTAVKYNPAGLHYLEKINVILNIKVPSREYEFETDGYSAEGNQPEPAPTLDFFGFSVPYKISGRKFVTGIYANNHLYTDYHFGFSNKEDTYDETERGETTLSSLTLGQSIELREHLSVGFSLNLWTGSINAYRLVQNHPGPFFYSKNEDHYMQLDGFNVNFGGMYDLNHIENPIPLKLGLSIKSPFKLKIDDHFQSETQVYLQGTDTLDINQKLELNMPWMIGIGGSYELREHLTVAADYEFRGFSNSKMVLKTIDNDTPEEDIETKITNNDIHLLRLGMEYQIHLGKWMIPFRAGVQNNQMTFYNENDYGDPTKLVQGIRGAFGTGFHIGRFGFDITFANLRYEMEKADVTYSVQDRLIVSSLSMDIF